MNFKRFKRNLIELTSVDSTNNYAANLLKTTNVVNGTTILTKRQENGRGQIGTTWHAAPGKNLIVSTILFPLLKNERAFYLNIAVSLAVNKTLLDVGIDSKVKWPNDIYVNGNKIAGILIENQIQGKLIHSSIIGLGLNVNQLIFPEGINGTSIAMEKGIELEIDTVFENYFANLDFYCDILMQSNFDLLLKKYYAVMHCYDELCEFQDVSGVFEGRIKGIDDIGKLQVLTENGVKKFDLKEVKFRTF
jgi:BirA family biotin operon repressor/biotin-[acetyl-CoA-carboxylase] ligase